MAESNEPVTGEMDRYMMWANELCKQDPDFAKAIIFGIPAEQFPDTAMLDKTE